jgi:hypothetical protein
MLSVYFSLKEDTAVMWKYNEKHNQWKTYYVNRNTREPVDRSAENEDYYLDFENFANSFLQQGKPVSLCTYYADQTIVGTRHGRARRSIS